MSVILATQPHHDGSPLYVSVAAPELSEKVRLRLRVPPEYGLVARAGIRSNPDREPRWDEAVMVAEIEGVVWWEAEVALENPELGYRWWLVGPDGALRWLTAVGLSEFEPRDGDDFRLVSHAPPPAWAAEQIMYQVMPDRFARSAAAETRPIPEWAEPAQWDDTPIGAGPSTPRQFFGGDLDGITENLDHLERLGVTLLYLTPFFPAASNHRYDAHSFDSVDPMLGGDAALERLVRAAHERGIRVIGDLTTNHTGDGHEWFRAAHGHPDAAEGAFYYWQDAGHEHYESWLGVPSLPKLDWRSPELRRRVIEGDGSVVARWLQPPFSLDGWRIDVANMTCRLLDHDVNGEVRRALRRTMNEVNPDTLLIAEITNDASSDMGGDAWHGAMTYPAFTRPVWSWLTEAGPAEWYFGQPHELMPRSSGEQLVAAHRTFTAAYPWRTRLCLMNALDTHDTARFAGYAMPGAVPVAVGLAVTLPGIPVVFAGDELGHTGANGEYSRTTMPWARMDDHRASIDEHAALLALRRQNPALSGGGVRWLHAEADAIVFLRETTNQTVLVCAARGDVSIDLPVSAFGGEAHRLIGHAHLEGHRVTSQGMSFTAWSLPGAPAPEFEPSSRRC